MLCASLRTTFGDIQVVQWLLANNYLLSALELLVEAQEAGNEGEVEQLQLFFGDRDKFPPEVVAQFDQSDGAKALIFASS